MGLFAGTKWDLPPTCDRCQRLESECDCPPIVETQPEVPASKQTLRLRTENRKGKRTVTLITGAKGDASQRSKLLSQLKTACGVGGSIEDEFLVLQGDQIAKATPLLKQWGYQVKS